MILHTGQLAALITGAHTSLPRLAVWLTLGHNIGGQSYNIECTHSIDVQHTLEVFQWVGTFLGQRALGNAHPRTVDDSIEPTILLLGNLDNMPHV